MVGLGHKVADCRTPGGPRASTGSLVGRVRVHKPSVLFPIHWWYLLVGRAGAQVVPGQGLACWWASWVCRLQVCGFLASGV